MTVVAPTLAPIDAPFDQFQRYMVARDVARAMAGPAPTRVLDVGGHHLDFWSRPRRPIAEFLPECRTITIDLAENRLPGYVRGRGDALPFRDRCMDLVCAVDVLEHVPVPARPAVIDQAMRVSSRTVLLAAPFRSDAVVAAEALVSRFIREACGYEQGQLHEHRTLGWPDLDETVVAFERAGWHVRLFGYGHVWHWALMMIDKHAVGALTGSRGVQTRLDRRYNETQAATDTAAPWYRQFVLATRSGDDPVLGWAAERFAACPRAEHHARADRHAAPSAPVQRVLEIHAANQALQIQLEPERRTAHIADAEEHRAQLLAAQVHLRAENQRLEGLLKDVEQSTAFRLVSWARRLLRVP